MRTEVKSGGLNNSRVTTSAFDKLTKAELIELLSGDIKAPITPAELYRCAVSIVAKWCNEVIADRYASMFDVTNGLESLEKLYKNR
jgi:hypothetical protein